jgi:prepilin-type N-terminal cleavage/methylation domain-containing protein
MINRKNKKAFTLLELIFVIVIIGVMVGVGSSAFKPKYLIDDSNFILAKIKEAQYKGIGFEHLNFDGSVMGGYDDRGCITFSKANLSQENYKIKVELSGDLKDAKVCFDSQGRPREDSFNGSLISTKEELVLSFAGDSKKISIMPLTGYSYISDN